MRVFKSFQRNSDGIEVSPTALVSECLKSQKSNTSPKTCQATKIRLETDQKVEF